MIKCPICGKDTSHMNLHLKETHGLTVTEIKKVWKKIPRQKGLDHDLLRGIMRKAEAEG